MSSKYYWSKTFNACNFSWRYPAKIIQALISATNCYQPGTIIRPISNIELFKIAVHTHLQTSEQYPVTQLLTAGIRYTG